MFEANKGVTRTCNKSSDKIWYHKTVVLVVVVGLVVLGRGTEEDNAYHRAYLITSMVYGIIVTNSRYWHSSAVIS